MRTLIVAALATAAAACSGGDQSGQPAANQSNQAAASAATTQERILALPEPQRLAVFLNAIRDSRLDCQEVQSAESAGSHEGLPMWRATCRNGVTWTILIGGDGVAQVLNPAEADLLSNAVGNDSPAAR